MVAHERLHAQPRIPNVRAARHATQRRRKHSTRARHATLLRFSAGLFVVFAMVMGYVMLMANLTSMNYAVARAERQRAALVDQTARLDDRVAALRSQERLSRVATMLGMRDAQQYAVVSLAPAAKAAKAAHVRGPLLGNLAALFTPKYR